MTISLRVAGCLLLTLVVFPSALEARVLKSLGKALHSDGSPTTIGAGLDYQADDEETEYDFSAIIEHGLTESFTLAFEPNYILLDRAGGSTVSGFGEFETSLSWSALEATEKSPGLSVLGLIKLPTASSRELGTGETDFTFGLSANKEFESADADLSALYTFVGSPPGMELDNSIELILAGEWYASDVVSLMAELTAIDGAGRSHAQTGNLQGLAANESRSERSVTLGISEQISENMKLEQGLIYVLDGAFQIALAWEITLGDR